MLFIRNWYYSKCKFNIFIIFTCDELTTCLLSVDQSMHSTFPWWPLRILRDLILNPVRLSSFCATTATVMEKHNF